ncbi:MAG TPA: TRAP transporter small permease [Sphaerochaeta sp.]|nr:TRAP transporter small permease [Sphaerochaeta sp.]
MNKFILGLDNVLSILGKALVAILASGVIISVILRYVFSIAFVSSEELLTMVFVSTTFFGAALGLREDEHIAVNNFTAMMGDKLRKLCNVLSEVFIIIVSVVMIIYSIRMIQKVGGVVSPATGIARGYYYSLMPISFVFTIFYAIVNILKLYMHIDEPVKGYKEDFELGMEVMEGDA